MTAHRILYADNDSIFLDTRTEFLEREGFQVQKANSYEEALRILREEVIHLAILDQRMVDNYNDLDRSGVRLAQMEEFSAVPKVILTAYPEYLLAVEVMGLKRNGKQTALSYLDKREGPVKLIETVKEVLATLPTNFDLKIDTREVSFPDLASRIAEQSPASQPAMPAAHLKELFRRLFSKAQGIKLDHKLWERNGVVALLVHEFNENKGHELRVVTCGRVGAITDEAERYRNNAPSAPGRVSTFLLDSRETVHFAANVYALAGAGPKKPLTLFDLYSHGDSEKQLSDALRSLFSQTLADWHSGDPQNDEKGRSLNQIYRELSLPEEDRISPASLDRKLEELMRQMPVWLKVKREHQTLTLQFSGRSGSQCYSYGDPFALIHQKAESEDPVPLVKSPALLTGKNVLTDGEGNTWLTDFAAANWVPRLWNFIELEAAVRFDWVKTQNLSLLYDMEHKLAESDTAKPDIRGLDSPIRRLMKTIQTIRRLAFENATDRADAQAYHLGLLFQAVKRLAAYDAQSRLLPDEQTRLAHLLIAAAMIGASIHELQKTIASSSEHQETGLRIDEKTDDVLIDGKVRYLTPKCLELLYVLYQNRNHHCTRQKLFECVFEEDYDEKNEEKTKKQDNRLNQLITRLREEIEPDPSNPRFLKTVPNKGYVLIC